MIRRSRGAAVLLLLLVATASLPAAAALRCGSRLVDTGDADFRVRDRCGEPFWTETYLATDVFAQGRDVQRLREVRWDVWYYNFGPRALMQKLVFVDGALRSIESLGYGVGEIGANCDARMGYSGMSAGEVVARCGEPQWRRSSNDTVVQRPGQGLERWRDERREAWTYDFGDGQLLRTLHLVNGRVTAVEHTAR